MKTKVNYTICVFVTFMALSIPIIATVDNQTAVATATQVPILTETPTAIPARDLDLLPTFESLMENNYENCNLPCWWGLKPGKTTIDELITFISENDIDRRWELPPYKFTLEQHLGFNEPLLFDFQESFYDTAYSFLISFSFTNSQLIGLKMNFAEPNEWLITSADRVSFPKVVKQIIETPEIYINECSDPKKLDTKMSVLILAPVLAVEPANFPQIRWA